MAKKKINKQLVDQLSQQYPYLTSILSEAIRDDEITLQEYREMLRKDETVGAAVEFLAYNVVNRIGEYNHTNDEIRQFVRLNLANMEPSLPIALTQLVVNMIAYGFSVGELVWELDSDRLLLKRIVPLPSYSITFQTQNGEITKAVQHTASGKIELPIEKLLILKDGEGVYGESKLRRAWRPYRFKKALFTFWAVAMERYAMPILYGKSVDTQGMFEALKNLWSQGVIATGPSDEVDLVEPRNNVADAYREAIEYLNILIARAVLVPKLLFSVERTGSYSLGRIQFDMFLVGVERLANVVSEALIDQVVARIIDYNFGEANEYGTFVYTKRPSSEDMSRLANAFMQLVNAGIIDPIEDANWVRTLLGFPELPPVEPSSEEEKEAQDAIWGALERTLTSEADSKENSKS